jgi:hypothetical protein
MQNLKRHQLTAQNDPGEREESSKFEETGKTNLNAVAH